MVDKLKIKKQAIIMLGAPGSGKGTQGAILEEKTKYRRYVMSELIKKEVKKGIKLYEKIFTKGELLEDKDIFIIFRKKFKGENNIILDGIPRTLDQAYWLYGYLMRHNYEIKLIFLEVDEKKLLKRITSRRYCPKCHTLYNIISKQEKKRGFCDNDGEKLIQREDDTKEVFSERLKTFDEVKQVILDVYHGEVVEINGDQEIEKVSQEIMKKIIVVK